MCAFRQPLLAFGLTAALLAPAAQAQQRPHFGQAPRAIPTRDGAQFGQPQFGHPAFPQAPQHQDNNDNAPPMSDSVRRAQQLSGGRVIGTERVQADGHAINRVKVVDGDGRVRYIDDNRQMPHRDGAPQQYPQNAPQTP